MSPSPLARRSGRGSTAYIFVETWLVHALATPGAFATSVLGWNLRPLIEFVLQLPLESHKVLPPLPYQYPCLDRVVSE
jgi:hypothetical protein